MSVTILKAALPPSCYRTGKTAAGSRDRRSGCDRFVQVQPAALPGRRGARRSFWDVASAGVDSRHTEAKGVLADPLYVFGAAGRARTPGVVLLTATVTAMTEPRGVATREGRSHSRYYLFQTAVSQVGNSGVRALTLVSIYGFAGDPTFISYHASKVSNSKPSVLDRILVYRLVWIHVDDLRWLRSSIICEVVATTVRRESHQELWPTVQCRWGMQKLIDLLQQETFVLRCRYKEVACFMHGISSVRQRLLVACRERDPQLLFNFSKFHRNQSRRTLG